MRITSIELAGFRAFGAEAVLDLAADAVILVGPNGSGKTSVLDGILWSLTGRVPRMRVVTSPWSPCTPRLVVRG